MEQTPISIPRGSIVRRSRLHLRATANLGDQLQRKSGRSAEPQRRGISVQWQRLKGFFHCRQQDCILPNSNRAERTRLFPIVAIVPDVAQGKSADLTVHLRERETPPKKPSRRAVPRSIQPFVPPGWRARASVDVHLLSKAMIGPKCNAIRRVSLSASALSGCPHALGGKETEILSDL